jgi:hypothetical protein
MGGWGVGNSNCYVVFCLLFNIYFFRLCFIGVNWCYCHYYFVFGNCIIAMISMITIMIIIVDVITSIYV